MKRVLSFILASALPLLLGGASAQAGIIIQTTTYADNFTDFQDQPLSPALLRFDTLGGTRILESVKITASSWVTSAISGTIENLSNNQIAIYEFSVDNVFTSIAGPGLVGPVSEFSPNFFSLGDPTVNLLDTLTIPFTSDRLTASTEITLTDPADLAIFIGSGNLADYITTGQAEITNSISGSSNTIENITISTTGGASVTLEYTYSDSAATIVPEPGSLLVFAGLSLGLIFHGGCRKLRTRRLSQPA